MLVTSNKYTLEVEVMVFILVLFHNLFCNKQSNEWSSSP